MPALVNAQIEKIKQHLGYYSPAVPAGYATLLAKSIARERSTEEITYINTLIARCDRVFTQTEPNEQGDGVEYRRVITGDTNRTDIQYRPLSQAQLERDYVRETNRLGDCLGVPNFHSPEYKALLNIDRLFPPTL